MSNSFIKISWPNGKTTFTTYGNSWLDAAKEAGIMIPTGCLSGSCGSCEIDVNGETIRACISNIEGFSERNLEVEFSYDEFW